MKKMDPIRLRYYGAGILPLSFIVVLLVLMDIYTLNLLFFILGFWWNYSIFTPGVEERTRITRYRFSFLRIILKINQLARVKLSHHKHCAIIQLVVRIALPSLFILMLWSISTRGNPLFGLAGALLFEGFIYLWRRLNKLPGKSL